MDINIIVFCVYAGTGNETLVTGLSNRATSTLCRCIPYPQQGHINPMMQLAKLLHSRGFLITFVNTDFSRRHLVSAG